MPGAQPRIILDKDLFDKILEPYFNDTGFSSRTLIVFTVSLPFWIPVPELSTFTYPGDTNESRSSLLFTSTQQPVEMHFGYDLQHSPLVARRSIVEMIFSSSNRLQTHPSQDDLTRAFESCLEKLNTFIAAYLAFSRDHRVHALSREMFDPFLLYTHYRLPEWSEPESGIFLVHTEVPTDPAYLTPEELQRVVVLSFARMKGLNPFMNTIEIRAGAMRHFKSGFYKEAVMLVQASVESFVRTTYRLLLETEGKTDLEIVRAFEDTAFMSIIKKELHSRLGGSWSLSGSGPVAGWYAGTYVLRNRVSHGGYEPAYPEVLESLRSADVFRNFIARRIKASRRKYPAVAALLS